VPQGGNTGLVGGSVPRGGEIVLSLRRLDALDPVDVVAGQVAVGAGASLAAVQSHVATAGFDVGIDLAARDSATVGGMVATNAGGVHVLRHGTMRTRVVGLEAVLADGSIVTRMEGLLKDNSGYDLTGLFCGSEGTLAVVTRVRLRLVPRPPNLVVVLAGLASTPDALAVVTRVRGIESLQAAEIMHADGLELVRTHARLPLPLARAHSVYLLLEFGGDRDPTDDVARVVADCAEVTDTAVAADGPGRAALWAYRERHTEVINAIGIPHKLDVTLPPARLADFETAVRADVATAFPGSTVVLFGHLGDGNIHVNIVGPDPADDTVDDLVLRLVAARGGSISAEHGIGVAKVPWLPLTRSPADLAAMVAVKRALDPDNILNPGVILRT
jgi:FAD/FMN-containing dehydrogenase